MNAQQVQYIHFMYGALTTVTAIALVTTLWLDYERGYRRAQLVGLLCGVLGALIIAGYFLMGIEA